MAGALDDFEILVLPGWRGSGPTHWQHQWEAAFPALRRVQQADWDQPVFADWLPPLRDAVGRATRPVVIIGHSLGTSLTMLFSLRDGAPDLVARIAGAFLVAPTDRDMRDGIPGGPVGFGPMILKPFPFRSMVVASDDDEYVSIERARVFARAWGSRLIEIGARGHIGSEADLGLWPEGLVLFGEFVGGLRG
jgi:uncharacterized protein